MTDTTEMPQLHIARTIIMRSVAALVPYVRNARTHSAEQVAQIALSIQKFGFTNPILVDETGGVIAGHGRLLAAQLLGLEFVPTIELGYLTEAQKRAYVIVDNKLAENAGWDEELLRSELAAIQASGIDPTVTGFLDAEIAALVRRDGATDPDDAPPVEEIAVTRPGDVWVLGEHRLVCGDATEMDDIIVDLIVTSPPYNQKLDAFKPSGMHREHDWVRKVGRLAYPDSMPEPEYQAWQRRLLDTWHAHLRDGGSVFYNHKHRYREKRCVTPLEWLPGPFAFRQEIVWRRPGSVTQNARMFLPCDERIYWLYRGDDFTFDDTTEVKTWSSVWDITPQSKNHAAAYPVELPRRCILAASAPGECVLDPFSGSGTTLIAAEMTGRRCHAIEIAPAYCDVAVRRWEKFRGGGGFKSNSRRLRPDLRRSRGGEADAVR